MAKLDAITLNDGLTTPVARTFKVAKQEGSVGILQMVNTAVPSSERPTVTIGLRHATKRAPQKATVKVVVPPSAAELLADPACGDVTVFIHVICTEKASAQRRLDAVAFSKNATSQAIFTEAVNDGLAPY